MIGVRHLLACVLILAFAQYQVSANACDTLNRLSANGNGGCGACKPSFFGLPAGSLCPCANPAPTNEFETLVAARFRNFAANGGVQLVFVGKPDLGIPGNRAEGGNTWTNGARNVRFWRDGATIKASNGANTVSYALPSSNTCTPDKYNFLRVSVRQNSDTAAISVSNILVSGTPYAGPTAVTNTLVNADYVHVGQLSSFDITATVNIGARAGCTNENCRVEFQVGCHKVCTAPYDDQPFETCDCPSGQIHDGCTSTVASNTNGKCVCLEAATAPGPCDDGSLSCTA